MFVTLACQSHLQADPWGRLTRATPSLPFYPPPLVILQEAWNTQKEKIPSKREKRIFSVSNKMPESGPSAETCQEARWGGFDLVSLPAPGHSPVAGLLLCVAGHTPSWGRTWLGFVPTPGRHAGAWRTELCTASPGGTGGPVRSLSRAERLPQGHSPRSRPASGSHTAPEEGS